MTQCGEELSMPLCSSAEPIESSWSIISRRLQQQLATGWRKILYFGKRCMRHDTLDQLCCDYSFHPTIPCSHANVVFFFAFRISLSILFCSSILFKCALIFCFSFFSWYSVTASATSTSSTTSATYDFFALRWLWYLYALAILKRRQQLRPLSQKDMRLETACLLEHGAFDVAVLWEQFLFEIHPVNA
jgi:hypothetical protein